jgi:16S rRNA G966 N2-methylase RsmD
MSNQIESKRIAQKKLPSWFLNPSVYYPKKIHLEQSSSEITAAYKTSLVEGCSLLDLTGGFGVDTIYFSKKIREVIHCEINQDLSEVVSHNFKQMQVNNCTVLAEDGIKFLTNTKQKFDWIFADPSRRNKQNNKVFLLQDCEPEIPRHIELLFEHTDMILLKLSPVLDITATLKELRNVKEIHSLAVDNELKELLLVLEKGWTKPPNIKAVNIQKGNLESFEAEFPDTGTATFAPPKNYLYEPNAAILKAGLFNSISTVFKIDKLHPNSHLYTSQEKISFPGRTFSILHIEVADRKKLLALIPSKKANITTRNFPQSVQEIRKKFGLQEGGDLYLFFTTNMDNKHVVLLCEKIMR